MRPSGAESAARISPHAWAPFVPFARAGVRSQSGRLYLSGTFISGQAGGSVNLLPHRTPAHSNVVQSDAYDPENDFDGSNLGTFANSRLCRDGTNGLNFLMILEAPPGFEPGMEVLQTYAASLSAAISRSQPDSWFQLAMFWSTILRS